MFKTNPLLLETMQCPIIKAFKGFLVLEAGKTQKKDKNFQKNWQKIAKISIILRVCDCSTKI